MPRTLRSSEYGTIKTVKATYKTVKARVPGVGCRVDLLSEREELGLRSLALLDQPLLQRQIFCAPLLGFLLRLRHLREFRRFLVQEKQGSQPVIQTAAFSVVQIYITPYKDLHSYIETVF